LLTTSLSFVATADVTSCGSRRRWPAAGGGDALRAGLGHRLALTRRHQHGVDQQRVEDGQQHERNEREQRLVGVLVAERVAGGEVRRLRLTTTRCRASSPASGRTRSADTTAGWCWRRRRLPAGRGSRRTRAGWCRKPGRQGGAGRRYTDHDHDQPRSLRRAQHLHNRTHHCTPPRPGGTHFTPRTAASPELYRLSFSVLSG